MQKINNIKPINPEHIKIKSTKPKSLRDEPYPQGIKVVFNFEQSKKKKFIIQLYPEEYDKITAIIKEL